MYNEKNNFILCLIEIVGTPVVNIMTKSSRHHRKGIKVWVVFSQPSSLFEEDKKQVGIKSILVNICLKIGT